MKKFLLLLLLPLLSFGQLRDSVYVKTDIYEVMYSETLEQPLWVKYQVACTNGTAKRTGMDFYTVKEYKTSDAKDYEKNEWDKGHVAPAADFNCTKDMLYKTFSYLNCTLQHEKLNRVHWRLLEDYERTLATTQGPVDVEVRIIFDKTPKRVPTGAAIPFAFKKIIKTKTQTLCYYFLNEPPKLPSFNEYQLNCN